MPKAIQPDFKSIFESAPGLNLILLPDLTIIAVSNAYLEATMTKRFDIIGHYLFEIFPDNPDDSSATGVSNLRFSLNYVLEQKAAHSMAVQKYDIRKVDGTFEQRYWSPINKPVLDTANEVVYIIHRVEDVTEFMGAKKDEAEKEERSTILQKQMGDMEIETYKRAQEIQQLNLKLLNEIEERKKAEVKLIQMNQGLDHKVLERAGEILKSKNILSETLERITNAFVGLDKNWCYTYLNKKAGEIFNREPKTMIGKHIWTEFPDGINQPFYKAYYKAMETQQYIYLEEYYAAYDLWFENHIYPSAEGLSIFFRDITEKKKAEKALKEKNNFIDSIINASPDIIYIYDIEERKNIYANEGIQSNLGYSDDEIKEMGNQVISILMHPEDFDFYIHTTYPKYETLKNKEIIAHEYRMKSKDGNWHWLNSKESIFLRKPDGSPKQIFGITTNITEHKKAEEEVTRVYKEMDTALNRITDSIVSVDREWRYIFMNGAALATHPMGREETMGKIIWDVHPELNKTLFGEKFKEVMQTQIATEFENYYPPYNIWVNMKAYPSANGLTLYYENVTERKKAEIAIQESEEKYRTLVEQASDAIFIADANGRFITVNTSACKLSEYSEEELLQMSIYDFAILENIQREPFHFDELKQGKTVNTERLMKRKNGTPFYIEINAKLLSDGRLLTFVRDITERKKAEEKILQLNLDLEIRVKDRTAELEKTNVELEEINDLFVGREARMIELKEELEALKNKPRL